MSMYINRRCNTWLAKPWSGPARPFNAAANER